VLALLNAAMLWSARRQLQRGQRDVLANVAIGGIVVISLAALIVVSLIA
jgi:hypothetical protein